MDYSVFTLQGLYAGSLKECETQADTIAGYPAREYFSNGNIKFYAQDGNPIGIMQIKDGAKNTTKNK